MPQPYRDPRGTSFAQPASHIQDRHSPPSFIRQRMVTSVRHRFSILILQLFFHFLCRGLVSRHHSFRRLEPERRFPNDLDEWTWVSTLPSTIPHSPLRCQAVSRAKRARERFFAARGGPRFWIGWKQARVRHVCSANSNAGVFCSHTDASAVIVEGLKRVKAAFDQYKCAPIVPRSSPPPPLLLLELLLTP